MKRVLPVLALFAMMLVSITGCKKESNPVQPPPPSMSGNWAASAGGYTFTFTLTENNGAISGMGQQQWASGTLAHTITGTHVHPNVTMTFKATGYQDTNFQGSFTNDNTVAGKLNGSGWVDQAISLLRQ
jgi:hypothetical protein